MKNINKETKKNINEETNKGEIKMNTNTNEQETLIIDEGQGGKTNMNKNTKKIIITIVAFALIIAGSITGLVIAENSKTKEMNTLYHLTSFITETDNKEIKEILPTEDIDYFNFLRTSAFEANDIETMRSLPNLMIASSETFTRNKTVNTINALLKEAELMSLDNEKSNAGENESFEIKRKTVLTEITDLKVVATDMVVTDVKESVVKMNGTREGQLIDKDDITLDLKGYLVAFKLENQKLETKTAAIIQTLIDKKAEVNATIVARLVEEQRIADEQAAQNNTGGSSGESGSGGYVYDDGDDYDYDYPSYDSGSGSGTGGSNPGGTGGSNPGGTGGYDPGNAIGGGCEGKVMSPDGRTCL